MEQNTQKSPVVFCLVEGLSLSSSWRGNALLSAKADNFNNLWSNYPHTVLTQSSFDDFSSFLTLSSGQTSLTNEEYIAEQIESKVALDNQKINLLFNNVLKNNSSLHLFITLVGNKDNDVVIDLLSLYLKLARKDGVFNVFIHVVISDDKTNDPRNIITILNHLEGNIRKNGIGEIATIVGENYILNHATQASINKAEQLYVFGRGNKAMSSDQAVASKRKALKSLSETLPFFITRNGEPLSKIKDFDSIIFCNIDNKNISNFILSLSKKDNLSIVDNKLKFLSIFTTFKTHDDNFIHVSSLFEREIAEGFPSLISKNGLSQLYISDQYRLNHIKSYLSTKNLKNVTNVFFDTPDDVNAYAQDYNLILNEILKKTEDEISKNIYDFIFIDLPVLYFTSLNNSFKDTLKNIKEIDNFLGSLKNIVFKSNGALIISSINSKSNMPENAKSYPGLPFVFAIEGIIKNKKGKFNSFHNELMYDLMGKKHEINDIAPTILDLFKIEKPASMVGTDLLDSSILR